MTATTTEDGSMESYEVRTHEYAEGLRELLAQEEATIRNLRAKIDVHQGRKVRLQKAVDALVGEPLLKAKKPKAKGIWVPNAKSLDKVLAYVRTLDQPEHLTLIAQGAGLSHETTRRAILELREREQIRLVGVQKRGTGQKVQVYLPMPEAVADGA